MRSGPAKGHRLRVLHCLNDVGGNAVVLAAAERSLGLDSVAVTLRAQSFGYHGYEVLCGPDDGFARQERQRFALLARAVRHFDVIHFNFGRTIMPPWQGWGTARGRGLPRWVEPGVDAYLRALWMKDLPLLRALGKRLFITYQGDDVRQGDVLAREYDVSPVGEVDPDYYVRRADRAKRRAVRVVDRYVDGIFALNPDLLRVLPDRARFLAYSTIDLDEWRPAPPAETDEPPLVIHAPTHRGVKGTNHVLAAVDQLRREGVPFRFELIEGLTRDDARRLYERADLLVDQLLVGWYGGLAVELMALGRPVVAYLRPRDLGYLPPDMRRDLPVVSATPGDVTEVLRGLLTGGRGHLRQLGQESRRYVERWHDPARLAAQTAAAYEAAEPRRVRRSPRLR